ncbi:MAG: 30S ribosomal protein S8 [Patescibacteria group bacterium]|jgi:small subunit ribosomal protein S8
MTDPIADMLTRIRNATTVNLPEVFVPASKIKLEIGKILVREGFIKEIQTIKNINKPGSSLHLVLKYKEGQSVIRGIKKISKPGRKVFHGYKHVPRILPSLGILLISTSRGLMTNTEVKKNKIGGEVICEIY